MKTIDFQVIVKFVLTVVVFISLPMVKIASQPAYASGTWVKTGGPIGGLGYDVRHSFDNHDNWYVTDAWGGIFYSEDRGLSWNSINEGITSRKAIDAIPVFCVTVDPHNSQTVWIGTELSGDIYKSTDSGKTWIEKSNGIPDTLRPLTFRGITIDPNIPDILYAMAEIGSSGWTPDGLARVGIEMDLTKGIVFKSTDGGENWISIWMGNNLARYCWINPDNSDEIYISTGIFDRESANTDVEKGEAGGVGILKSGDGGETWQVLDQDNGLSDLYLGSLFMHPENPETLLAAAGQNNWSSYGDVFTGGIYLTINGGENWQKMSTEEEIFTVVEYCISDPDYAYALSARAVYRSEDAGQTWIRFSRENNTWGPPGVIAGIPIDMQCDPDDPLRIIVNNYLGGNFLSIDGGENWIIASDGYTGSLIRCLAIAPNQPELIYVGSRSGIYSSKNGGENWFGLANQPVGLPAKFNEVNTIAVNPFDPQSLRTVATDYPGVLYSYDAGKSWHNSDMFTGLYDLQFLPTDSNILFGLARNPNLLISPELIPPDEAYNPSLGLYLSTTAGISWVQLESDSVKGKCIASYAVDPHNLDIMFISNCQGTMLKSSNGGASWIKIGVGLPQIPAISLEISKMNPNIMYAGLGILIPERGEGLFKSSDGGENWDKLVAGLDPNSLIKSIAIDPNNDSLVYIADYFSGVYFSNDAGATWQKMNDHLDHKDANQLALSDDGQVLYLGTEGGGVYRMGEINVQTSNFSVNRFGSDLIVLEHGFPNPFTVSSTINYTVMNSSKIKLSVYNLSGQHIKTLVNELHTPGHYSTSWDGSNNNGNLVEDGTYILTIYSGEIMRSEKIILIK
jgi:photosystem II stability/assembly factor-like uncharacterized protein